MEKEASKNKNTAENNICTGNDLQIKGRVKTAAMFSRIGLVLSVLGIGLIFSLCGIIYGAVCSRAGEPLGKTAVALGVAGAVLSLMFGGMFFVCAFLLF